jgi:hexulose-6-phosphate isomerase
MEREGFVMGRVGFMQGRLSPLVDGRIQAFPWRDWEQEFEQASRIGLRLMEWTLDHERLRENPLLTTEGRKRLLALAQAHGVAVESVTGDCFMQAPFYKATGPARAALLDDFCAVVEAASVIGAHHVVFPLVDNGSIENGRQEQALMQGLLGIEPLLRERRVRVVFESDYGPERLLTFIERLPPATFGVNYDIGNSAALGYDAAEEIAAYGHRICHVHVKDRVLNGTTVPLGQGNADFPLVFSGLRRADYTGDYILQTARAPDGDHAGALKRYNELVQGWLSEYGPRA